MPRNHPDARIGLSVWLQTYIRVNVEDSTAWQTAWQKPVSTLVQMPSTGINMEGGLCEDECIEALFRCCQKQSDRDYFVYKDDASYYEQGGRNFCQNSSFYLFHVNDEGMPLVIKVYTKPGCTNYFVTVYVPENPGNRCTTRRGTKGFTTQDVKNAIASVNPGITVSENDIDRVYYTSNPRLFLFICLQRFFNELTDPVLATNTEQMMATQAGALFPHLQSILGAETTKSRQCNTCHQWHAIPLFERSSEHVIYGDAEFHCSHIGMACWTGQVVGPSNHARTACLHRHNETTQSMWKKRNEQLEAELKTTKAKLEDEETLWKNHNEQLEAELTITKAKLEDEETLWKNHNKQLEAELTTTKAKLEAVLTITRASALRSENAQQQTIHVGASLANFRKDITDALDSMKQGIMQAHEDWQRKGVEALGTRMEEVLANNGIDEDWQRKGVEALGTRMEEP